jgi:peptidoglycan/LPS O-acetylase OafA/YrhL
MEYFSIWPVFAGLAALLLLVSTRPFAVLDAPSAAEAGRVSTLDGLRGFLALAVVFHHGAIYHVLLTGGGWRLPPSQFHAMIGPMGVAMFFMVTGYLFWRRVLRADGRLDWRSLYIGRLFRLGPLYLLAIAIMFAVIFAATGPVLAASIPALIGEIALWLPIGAIKGPKVNGFQDTEQILAGVTWTLRYEWLFYLSLPLLAWLLRRGWHRLRSPALVMAAALAITLFLPPNRDVYVTALFAIGMLTAALIEAGWVWRVPDRLASLLVLGCLGATILGFGSAYDAGSMLLLGGAFYLVTTGCTLFGLLTTRAARRLGHISYGIYLLQGLALALFFRPDAMAAFGRSSPVAHWTLVLASVLVLVIAAALAHILIERPGIKFGRRLAARGAPPPARLDEAVRP